MAFTAFPEQQQGVELLQRSLSRGRLGHAYLFTGHEISVLESLARTLAKTLNCIQPVRAKESGVAIDCCDHCLACRQIDDETHADVHWARPESKSRVIVIDQIRDLMHEIHLKANEAEYKVAVISGADRLNAQAANAFLKTLEEPPPKSVLILLTTQPQQLLETVVSRCLRLNFGGGGGGRPAAGSGEWLSAFGEMAAGGQKSLMGRYRILGTLLKRLAELKANVEKTLSARSPLERYDDVEKNLREKWEEELSAAIEAEYRRQRGDILAAVQWWLRDVWLRTMSLDGQLLSFPEMASTATVANRITGSQAIENLQILERTQRLLGSNVQEALALEVGFLKLHL